MLDLPGLCDGVVTAIQDCLGPPPDLQGCQQLPGHLLDEICDAVNLPVLCGGGGLLPRNSEASGPGLDLGTTIEDLLDGVVGNLGLPRTAPELTDDQRAQWDERFGEYDTDLALFLAAPVLEQEAAQ